MRIKYLWILIIVLISCSPKIPATENATNPDAANTGTTTSDIPYIVAKRYFVKNDYQKQNSFNSMITTQTQFDSLFGMAPIMGNKPTPIDFSTQNVLFVIGELTQKKTEIIPISLQQQHGTILFNYKIVEGEQTMATIQPALIVVLDKKYKGEVKLVKN